MSSRPQMRARDRTAHAQPWAAVVPAILACALLAWVGVKPTLVGINSDGAIYVLLADVYSPWRDSTIGFADHLFANYPFPPLYPLLLALLGGGTGAPRLDYLVGAVLSGSAVLSMYFWARRTGGSSVVAATCAVGFLLSPSTLLLAMGVYSEPLFLAVSMTAFAVLAAPQRTPRHWYVAAALFGLSALVRTVGIFAVAAFLAHWWVHTRARHHRWVIVLALAPQLAWSCIKWLRGWHTSYIGSLLDAGPAVATTELLGQLPTNARALWYYAVRTFDLLGSTYSALACALLLGLATLCLVQRLRRGEADALYVVLYLGVLLLWPYPNHGGRFLLMLLPFALAYASWGAGLLVRCAAAARLARAAEIAVAVLAACIILPSTLLITRQVAQFPSRPEADMVRTSTWHGRDSQVAARAAYIFGAEVLDAIGAMAPHIPPTACVTSTMPEMVMLRTHRASLRPPDADAGPAAMEAVLARCPYVLMLGASAFPAIGYPPYHPLQEVRSQLRALHSVPSSAPSFHDRPLAILAHYRPPSGAIADEDSL